MSVYKLPLNAGRSVTHLSFKSRLRVGGLSDVLFIPSVEDFFLRKEYDFLKQRSEIQMHLISLIKIRFFVKEMSKLSINPSQAYKIGA